MTVKSDTARLRAQNFLRDSGVDRVPLDLKGKVLDAYLAWIEEKPVAGAKFPPGSLAILAAEIPNSGPEGSITLELPCRVEGSFSQDLRFVVVGAGDVPFEYRSLLESTTGWWDVGRCFVTVATDFQLRPRVAGGKKIPSGEIWDPMAVVLRPAAPWTVGDEVDERLRRDVSGLDDDDEGYEDLEEPRT